MIDPEARETVLVMHNKGVPIKKIAHFMKMSRNSVRRIIRNRSTDNEENKGRHAQHIPLIRELFCGCEKNLVRVHEELTHTHKIVIPYSTLTRLAREYGISAPPVKRAGRYDFSPGEEMQHDTSPHNVVIGGKKLKAQCAGLVAAYSRYAFVQYYPRFTRFEAREFLRSACIFMGGACERCVIDNTSVVLSGGSGKNAVICSQMECFGRTFGFHFIAHEINHPDRKGRIERLFSYVEKNFLAGRTFNDWRDLNSQALQWCQNTANARHHKALGMKPEEAFVMEKQNLQPLPPHVPPVYKVESRIVDAEGYVVIDTNRYSVPQNLIGKQVDIHIHWEKLRVYFKNKLQAEHVRIIERSGARVTADGHHFKIKKKLRSEQSSKVESALRGKHEILDAYLDGLKECSNYNRTRSAKLLNYHQTFPEAPFLSALKEALKYRMFDLNRLEKMIIRQVSENYFNLEDFDG